MNPRERIDAILKNLGISQNAFASSIGVSRASISMVGAKTKTITPRLYNAILAKYPEINGDWLLTGNGNMFAGETEAKEVNHENIISVPLVNTYASAGFLRDYADVAYINTLPLHYTMRTKTKVDIAFEVSGDSMDCGSVESIMNGDVVLCSEVDMELLDGIKTRLDRYVFVIVHTDGIVVKKIANMDTEKMTLHSLNPFYRDYDIRLSDIRKLYRVVKVERELY